MNDAASAVFQSEVADFIYREAELLDALALREWLDLFHPEGVYWVPAVPG